MIFDREKADDIFRERVLEALDKAAKEVFGTWAKKGSEGASDADLDRIFKMLDKQIDALAARYEHVFTDDAAVIRRLESEERAFNALQEHFAQ